MKRFILAITLILVASSAFAQVLPVRYAAKFVCGMAGNTEIATFTAAPGRYFTAINVHNPATINANIQKRFSVGRLGEQPGPLSAFFPMLLPPSRTSEIECRSIYGHLNIPLGTFIEGFVEIRSNVELDVVGVYTTGGPVPGSPVTSILMERVPKR